MRIIHTCMNSAGLYKCVIAMWHCGRRHHNVISNEIIWLKEKGTLLEEKDVSSRKYYRLFCLHSCHNSNISLHCHDFTSCPEHCNKSSRAGEKDVTDRFECIAWLLMRFFFFLLLLPVANTTTNFLDRITSFEWGQRHGSVSDYNLLPALVAHS